MNVKIIGTIEPKTIYLVKFSFLNVSTEHCVTSDNYMNHAIKFGSQFKKVKDINITMELLKNLGKEK